MGKQSQLLLKPTEVELGLQVGVEFDKKQVCFEMLFSQFNGKPGHRGPTQPAYWKIPLLFF